MPIRIVRTVRPDDRTASRGTWRQEVVTDCNQRRDLETALAEDLLDVLHVVVDGRGLARCLPRGVRGPPLGGNRRADLRGQRAGGLVCGPGPRGDLRGGRPGRGLVLAARAGGAARVTGRPAALPAARGEEQ